ncbi:integrase [Pseudomonas guineae]|uniref:Integrase n=1 Tax=Pseudomonas guineae TaxID=425504 RepID=A0A1I3KG23_9PSED|nr:site-specific integrase [Pseudomonas guineae]SFI71290.1 integrase [Pseudomonas guineae]
MARKPMEWPAGIEPVGDKLRIRFTWAGSRRCETLPYPQTPKGIAAAVAIRDQVAQLKKLNLLSEDKYAELFPNSSYAVASLKPTFTEYAQLWIDSRQIVDATRRNYCSILNNVWVPHLGSKRIDMISAADLRKVAAAISWASPSHRKNSTVLLASIFRSAVADELTGRNPAASIPRSKVPRRPVDPFTREEADRIIAWLYANLAGPLRMYAAYFEFAFYTGLRPCEQLALKRSEVKEVERRAHICRLVSDGNIEERIKTKYTREVLLNERALHALGVAKQLHDGEFVFAPVDGSGPYIRSENTPKHYFQLALAALKIRARRQYDARHTYATMCLMAGMNPAFIAGQLGHSVQMLLTTYAKWLSSASDWTELNKL